MGLDTTKPVFGVSDKARLKPISSATATSYFIEISPVASLPMILSWMRITTAPIRLGRSAGWSTPLLFAIPVDKFSRVRAITLSLLTVTFVVCWFGLRSEPTDCQSRHRGYTTWVQTQTQNKAQWLAACVRKQPIIEFYLEFENEIQFNITHHAELTKLNTILPSVHYLLPVSQLLPQQSSTGLTYQRVSPQIVLNSPVKPANHSIRNE